MKLYIKPEDRVYEDVKYLIENKNVAMNVFGLLIKEDTFRRECTYSSLSSIGFLDRKVKKLNLSYSLGKYELLEDRTIVLYDKLHDKTT